MRRIGTEEAAILFNRSRSTIRRWAREGRLPGMKCEGRWVFDPRELSITWNTLMGDRKPSSRPTEDFQRFRDLIERIERRDVPIYEDAQREVLDLALSLLASEDGFRISVWRIIQRVKHAPGFAFFELIPNFVPIR